MQDRRWEVGICGTFDVENYGDLLFPLIAERELSERLGAVTLHRFSYHSKTPPEWPYAVTSVTALPDMIHRLDGLLIGGGFIVRFDKEVAVGYGPPAPEIHHPTGYWLTPALLALQHDVPVIWNAPGTDARPIPEWANPLLTAVLDLSRYIAVRDEPSRLALQRLTASPVTVVPDTAFGGLPRLLNFADPPSPEFRHLCEAVGLRPPYIVIHAISGLENFVQALKDHPRLFRDFQFLVLPIGPVLGNRIESIDNLPGALRLPEWPRPLLLAELIARSEAAVSQSYHLCITSLVAGVPVFTRHNLAAGKYSALQRFEGIFELPPDGRPDIEWFLARVGRKPPSAAVRDTCATLGKHWDRIAEQLRAGGMPTGPGIGRLWQSIPGYMDPASSQWESSMLIPEQPPGVPIPGTAGDSTGIRRRLDDTIRQLTVARTEIAARNARIAEILSSLSWRITAPLRFAAKPLFRRGRVLNIHLIRNHRLETYPYSWAAINSLYSVRDAERLSSTYPSDHFKLVSSYDGEKDYEYEVRPLIGMGANTISYPGELSAAWKQLAGDLLSPDYRAAMTALTGCDLSQAPIEANIFHYGPGGSMGPHLDLPAKLVTHVLYFNPSWNGADGGCLRILRSSDMEDVAAEIPPVIGYSSVLVRSENSWHAVSRIAAQITASRRAVTVTFYRPGSVSTMWPAGDNTPLRRAQAADLR